MGDTTISAAFTDKILEIRYTSLPDTAIEVSKQVALDGLGVILAGSTEPLGAGRICIDYVRGMGGTPQATVITGGFKPSMQNAAYTNGTMAHANCWI